MRHLGILLAVLAATLTTGLAPGSAVSAAAAPAPAPAPAASPAPRRAVVDGPAQPDAPAEPGVAARASTTGDCMASSTGWAKRPTACSSAYRWKVTCNDHVCVHYQSAGPNASTASWVQTTVSALAYIYDTYDKAGYRMPMADDVADGAPSADAGDVDIYLVDLATFDGGRYTGYYGYCAPTTPTRNLATSAFCVFDNDYADKGFTAPGETPADILHVTAAHEFFHAVQFGYDASADPWIMETSSVWAEDELYTSVNDNRQYLPYGPMGKPGFPMDDYWYEQHQTTLANGRSDPRDFTPYGDWIFFRYLTEHIAKRSGPLPMLVRQIWEEMDSVRMTNPKSSIDAVAAALRKHHTTLVKEWGAFSAANRDPAANYTEGSAYPVARPTHATTVSTSHPVRSGRLALAHLTAATERVTGSRVAQGERLRINVRVPSARARYATAWLTIWKADGKVAAHVITLRKGAGRTSLGFASSTVKRVELTVGNAQTTYRCQTGAMNSCDGSPTGDGMPFSWRATLSG